jgi:hypothetical protein
MDADHFASFLKRIGHRVVKSRSAIWYDANRCFFLSVPSHRLLDLQPEEIREILQHPPCFGLRFPTSLEGPGKMSYQIVCDTSDYGLHCLSANVRSKVRRGLKRCEVARVSFAELARDGVQADRDTLVRQGRPIRLSGRRWARYWEAAERTPGMEGWAASVSGVLAAFLVTVQFEDCVEFLLARSRDDLLEAYPNNALIFSVAEEMLVRRKLRAITFGLESLEPVESLDEFKLGLGFRRSPLRQRVVFHPFIRALLRRSSARAIVYRWADRYGSERTFWRKTAGLLRFAEDGGF